MKKTTKILAIILTMALVFTGCSSKPKDESNNSDQNKPTEAYKEETITIKNGDHEIPAIITLPVSKDDGKFPMVVMLHGTASDKNEAGGGYATYAPELAKSGIGSVRFDFIGTGDSKVDYKEYSFTTAISDVNAVIEYAKNLDTTNQEKIGLMGWSQGGTIAMLTAAQNADVKSLVTWAGATDYKNSGLITEADYEEAKQNGFAVVEFEWRDNLNFGLNWYEEAMNTDILGEFAKANVPTLAITGSVDTTVVPENAQKIVDAAQDKTSKTAVIEGADHTFNIFSGDMTKFNETCKATTAWFVDTLTK